MPATVSDRTRPIELDEKYIATPTAEVAALLIPDYAPEFESLICSQFGVSSTPNN